MRILDGVEEVGDGLAVTAANIEAAAWHESKAAIGEEVCMPDGKHDRPGVLASVDDVDKPCRIAVDAWCKWFTEHVAYMKKGNVYIYMFPELIYMNSRTSLRGQAR